MNVRQSGPSAVIKELAEVDCEQEVTENGMVHAGEEHRAENLIREGKEASRPGNTRLPPNSGK